MMLTAEDDLKHDREIIAYINERVYVDRTLRFVGGRERRKRRSPSRRKTSTKNDTPTVHQISKQDSEKREQKG